MLAHHLQPRAGRRTEIHHGARVAEEIVLLVELHQLERGSRSVALLLRKAVELVEAVLAKLRLPAHGPQRGGGR